MYRIPTLVKAANGSLIAFCEGRQSLFDHGNIDVVIKMSVDTGKTWKPIKVIRKGKGHTCGNACPVIDKRSGDILLVYTYDNKRVEVLRSKDNGENWSSPQDITASVKKQNQEWIATGPVHGIMMEHNLYKNRVVITCNYTSHGSSMYTSAVMYSDDHGETWKQGGGMPCGNSDECTVVELSDGKLMLNMRNIDRKCGRRKVSYSRDGGITWSECKLDSALIEPVCQTALLRYSFSPPVILFSNPANKNRRKDLSAYITSNEGKTWSLPFLIQKGPSAYSDMVVLPNGDVLCVFETGKIWPYGGISQKIIPARDISKLSSAF